MYRTEEAEAFFSLVPELKYSDRRIIRVHTCEVMFRIKSVMMFKGGILPVL